MMIEEMRDKYCTPNPLERHGDCCPMIIAQKMAKFVLSIKTLLALDAKISPRLIEALMAELEKD